MPSKRSGGPKKSAAPKKRATPSKPSGGSKKNTIPLRTFEEAARLFLKELPDAKEIDPEGVEVPVSGTGALRVLATANLNEWPQGVTSVLYLYQDTSQESSPETEETQEDPSDIIQNGNFHNIIGNWNAGGEANYTHLEGGGLIASVELTQEQHDPEDDDEFSDGIDSIDSSHFLLLHWRVEEGWAFSLLESGASETAKKMLGLRSSLTLKKSVKVWYGE